MANLSVIQRDIFNDNLAKRLVIKVNTRTLNAQNYLGSAKEIISEILPNWDSDPRVLFLCVDVWSERSFLVIDINHHNYDFGKAHQDETIFPVYVLQRRGKRREWAMTRWPPEDKSLSDELAELHRVNGYDVTPPFLEDHTSRIVHNNPRDLTTC